MKAIVNVKMLVGAMVLTSATQLQAGTTLGGLATDLSGGQVTYNSNNNNMTNNGTIRAMDEGRSWGGSHSNVAGMVNIAPSSVKTTVNLDNTNLINNGTIEAVNKSWTYGGANRNCAGMVNVGC